MHERWDGGGYPYGLAQEEIPFLSRLLAIAETFDVMTHDQVYKPAESVEQALQTISEEAGRQFDPALASAWVNWMRSREPKE
ncbi:Cyclic di-GMP phosphodiesterase response regulator RpfG [compost metagenome]